MTPDPTTEKEAPPVHRVDDVHLSGDLSAKDEGVFASLVSSFRDVFFPVKLPPLVLESKPIAVPDRMAVKRDPRSTAISTVVNGCLLALAIWWGTRKIIESTAPKPVAVITMDAEPPKAPPKPTTMGGGGGQKGPAPVSKGSPPKFEEHPILPPTKPPLVQPKLAVAPSIDVQPDLKMKADMPNIGMSNAPVVNGSMGNGNGSGLGSGNGGGMGPGSGGNTGGGARNIGGGVSAPKVLFAPEPEFSEEARKAKIQGNVVVYLEVDTNGRPINVRVIRGIGMGLDEKAVEAVKQYKFTPAMENGKPVRVKMNVEVTFTIF